MRLVVATPLYPPEIGGPATHAFFLEQALPAEGIEVRVVPFAAVRHLPKGIRHLRYAFLLARALSEAHLIFAEDTVSVGLPALFAARLKRVPLSVRVPGDHAWEQGRQRYGVTDSLDVFQHKRYGWRVELLRRIARFVVRHADRVIVPSEYFGHIVSGWLSDASHMRVIYNGVDPAPEPVRPARMPAHPFFVSAGRLVPWKGFEALIALVERLPGWTLVIVGEGPMGGELAASAYTRGIEGRVIFTGALPRAELFGWLEAADAFVLNSTFESFSYQVVEAMESGTPVIATGIGSIPELIADGTTGMLVEPDDLEALERALRSIHADRDRWGKRTAAARKAAARFSSSRVAKELAKELRTLARG